MNCEYCGTEVDEDGYVESDVPAVNGKTLHTATQCREYVHAALRSYKRECAELRTRILSEEERTKLTGDALFAEGQCAELREQVAEYEDALAGALGTDHPQAREGTPLERVSALARMVDVAEREARR